MPVPHPDVAAFAADLDFELDGFQREGCESLAAGRSTLVAAPTGAGKTVVGELACHLALARGVRCFYTTPIKALSNQKYADLVGVHGAEQVGLLTGDHAVNGEAPIVVMTTEVLRNMLYEERRGLASLGFVVLDEVHYLGDRERGAVWEEVVVQLDQSVVLACLSATVGNVEELGAWLASVRTAGCDVVITDHRPVPLEHHYAVNDDILPTFATGGGAGGTKADQRRRTEAAQALGGVPNPRIVALERQASRRGGRPSKRGHRPAQTTLRTPRRSQLVRELARRRWLPAIVFVFSRQGCDAAVDHVVGDGVRLTSPVERGEIRDVVAGAVAGLTAEDLDTIGYERFLRGAVAGVAPHHAGMVPALKEAVEALFVRGLCKVCYATETLALGINMPARTVVIERMEKWSGTGHELLTPGQLTQLTGRAGRRGLDQVGRAVVVRERDIGFRTVAGLVSSRTQPLRSSFRPSPNMAVNLLRRHDRASAEALLARSFAQFQADGSVAGDLERLGDLRSAETGYAPNVVSSVGDAGEYWALRRELSALESAAASNRKQRRAEASAAVLAGLVAGDVIGLVRGSSRPEPAVVVDPADPNRDDPSVSVVTPDARLRKVRARDMDEAPVRVGALDLPRTGGPRQAAYRREVVDALVAARLDTVERAPKTPVDADAAARIAGLREQLRAHPVHTDPALGEIEVWARRLDEVRDEAAALDASLSRRRGGLVRQLDRTIDLLVDLGYLGGDHASPRPTDDGMVLARIYAETDLVVAEALRRGVLDALDVAELAAAASVLTYTSRLRSAPPPELRTPALGLAVTALVEIRDSVAAAQDAARLEVVRELDAGLAGPVHRWAEGAELDEALAGHPLSVGDVVRAIKQAADLLGQIRDAADGELVVTARRARAAIVRGIVAHSGI